MDLKSEILKRLEANRGEYVSGEALSEGLGITRQAVWKAIKKLIGEGYIIDSVTNKGYMLDCKCDLLSSAVISDRTGATVYCYDEVDSTNTVAIQKLYTYGECIVVAESQTMGKAKNGARFASPSQKGIYMSVALKTAFPLEMTQTIKEKLSECVASILFDCCGTMPQIRGENELFIHDKKVCGILIEGEVNLTSKIVNNLIIGIGVYTAEVDKELGYISAEEPRNTLICNIYNAVKQIIK